MLNIVATQYSFNNNMLEIFVAGCSHSAKCASYCHNRQLWLYNIGTSFNDYKSKLSNKLEEFNDMINFIAVTGGEPLDRPVSQIMELLQFLSDFDIPIVLFTRKNLDEIPEEIKIYCDAIKTGMYDIEFKGERETVLGFTLQSTNQELHILNTRILERGE